MTKIPHDNIYLLGLRKMQQRNLHFVIFQQFLSLMKLNVW